MTFSTFSKRLAATGAASALATGALVGASTTWAHAAEINNTYTCQGTSGPFPVMLKSDIPGLASFPTASAGLSVPPALDVLNTFTVPSQVITTMTDLGITRLASPDFAGGLGASTVGVDGVEALTSSAVDNGNGTHSFDANGVNAAFEVPAAGTYDVVGPESFIIDAYNDTSADPVVSVPCVLATGTENGVYHTVLVTKNDSVSAAKATNSPVEQGKAAKVKVKVSAPNETPSGQVLLKKGTKTLAKGSLNDRGVVVLKTKALKVGKTRLSTVYKGDGYTNRSKDTVVVKVVR